MALLIMPGPAALILRPAAERTKRRLSFVMLTTVSCASLQELRYDYRRGFLSSLEPAHNAWRPEA